MKPFTNFCSALGGGLAGGAIVAAVVLLPGMLSNVDTNKQKFFVTQWPDSTSVVLWYVDAKVDRTTRRSEVDIQWLGRCGDDNVRERIIGDGNNNTVGKWNFSIMNSDPEINWEFKNLSNPDHPF